MRPAIVLLALCFSPGCIAVKCKCEKEAAQQQEGRPLPPQRDDGRVQTISKGGAP